MKLIGYCRLSTDEQTQGYGMVMQRQAMEDFCSRHGHELVQVYQEVASGTKFDRPVLQQALARLADVDGVIVYSICRLSRDRIDTQIIVDRVIYPAGKTLVATTQGVDVSTEEGRLLVAVYAGINQIERVKIVRRMTDGKKSKAKEGGYTGGRPAFGLRKTWVIDEAGNVIEKKLGPSEAELAIVDIIKRHRRSGKSANAIALWLNDHGYVTKAGKAWTHVQVGRLLKRNPPA
ncbi:DNA-invertase hin [compost metagenome]